MPNTTVPVTIYAGESLSAPADLTAGQLIRIQMPDDWWPPANISFQSSFDATNFADAFSANGNEIAMPVVAGTVVPVDLTVVDLRDATIKIRSGSRDHPVVQDEDRVFQLVVAS